jgi:hypothetical protein
MIDRVEQQRRGQKPPKYSTKHLYAAIEHRVIDSPAYADLTFSARALLIQIARQLSKDNNGRLQATHSYMRQYGFCENTLSRAIRELIAHGMIYRTRSGGYQQGAAQYAVTWLSLCSQRDGLFTDSFKSCAWHHWEPTRKKTPPSNLRYGSIKNGELTGSTTPKFKAVPPPKTEDIELMPCSSALSTHYAQLQRTGKHAMTYRPIPANQSRYQPIRYAA